MTDNNSENLNRAVNLHTAWCHLEVAWCRLDEENLDDFAEEVANQAEAVAKECAQCLGITLTEEGGEEKDTWELIQEIRDRLKEEGCLKYPPGIKP